MRPLQRTARPLLCAVGIVAAIVAGALTVLPWLDLSSSDGPFAWMGLGSDGGPQASHNSSILDLNPLSWTVVAAAALTIIAAATAIAPTPRTTISLMNIAAALSALVAAVVVVSIVCIPELFYSDLAQKLGIESFTPFTRSTLSIPVLVAVGGALIVMIICTGVLAVIRRPSRADATIR
ncbi:hypothetical protein [Gordonia sp. CPCC 205333]|uniref:hypothetical protein n=1 Tax=Gordonia sp. CPCC 205333 TaxID=3140790 RepID=UPI003AF3E356